MADPALRKLQLTEGGFTSSTSPVITANWEADSDDTWTVPLGGGGGRLMRFGKLPVNLQAQASYNLVKPDEAPTADWTLRPRSSSCPRSDQ